ncbi:MAG TPA: phage tail protein [Sphingomonas sp.]|nr:phage tail protein [Sphingomonas sp.]
MATIILTAVGTALGGPIGGVLGAMAGQAIDARLFRAAPRDGPRLTDLALQSSSYGTPIPKLFGTMRVAGTVIWSTDLIEHVSRDGGGKGRAGTTRYTYSASFAVALSARPILSVGRIWADGKLLRGAAGDFKTTTRFRLHMGDEAQTADPLIASAEGGETTPAFRGLAYAVFEDLALADFGNRIPSLTFEVIADVADVDSGAILAAMSGGVIDGTTGALVGGYAGHGDTVRGPGIDLLQASGGWLRGDGGRLTVHAGSGESVALADLGAGRGARRARSLAAADSAPRSVTLQHHDPARDYQIGLQRARRAGAGARTLAIELPAAIDAATAKGLAAATLHRLDTERERRTLSLDWRSLHVVPGDRVRIAGEAGLWRVVEATLEAMVLTIDLVRIARPPVAAPATSGAVVAAPDQRAGRTILHAMELPALDDAVLAAPRIAIMAAGTEAGWRGAGIQISLDGGTTWIPRGATMGLAVLGTLITPPGRGTATLEDRHGTLEVLLARDDMMLADADTDALDRGANLAMVGDELLQFGRAERLAGRRWRLRTLWRGRRGTERGIGAAAVGDRFVLLEPDALMAIDLPVGAIGTHVAVMASGVGDGDDPVVRSVAVDGRSVAPPPPVHASRVRTADGLDILRWVRRSRAGWAWRDGVATPLAEETEVYGLRVVGQDGADRMTTVAQAEVPGAAMSVEIRQIGTLAASRPLIFDL